MQYIKSFSLTFYLIKQISITETNDRQNEYEHVFFNSNKKLRNCVNNAIKKEFDKKFTNNKFDLPCHSTSYRLYLRYTKIYIFI